MRNLIDQALFGIWKGLLEPLLLLFSGVCVRLLPGWVSFSSYFLLLPLLHRNTMVCDKSPERPKWTKVAWYSLYQLDARKKKPKTMGNSNQGPLRDGPRDEALMLRCVNVLTKSAYNCYEKWPKPYFNKRYSQSIKAFLSNSWLGWVTVSWELLIKSRFDSGNLNPWVIFECFK